MEIGNLPKKEFRDHCKDNQRTQEENGCTEGEIRSFNKELENIKKWLNRIKEYNNWKKNAIEGINTRLNKAKDCIRELEDRRVKIINTKQKKRKKNEKKGKQRRKTKQENPNLKRSKTISICS